MNVARLSSALTLSVLAVVAHAAPTLTLLTPNVTIARPTSGSVTYDFLGTVTSTANPIQYSNAGGYVMHSAAFDGLPVEPYSDVEGTTVYTGRLFSVTVYADSTLGLYDRHFEAPHAIFFVSDGPDFAEARYSVNVVPQAVPEPASLAAFGLGATAVLRRRRKA